MPLREKRKECRKIFFYYAQVLYIGKNTSMCTLFKTAAPSYETMIIVIYKYSL